MIASLELVSPVLQHNLTVNLDKEALAIASYRTQTIYPVVDLLLCDDAHQFNWLTLELALCWIHEFRHYKQLIPRFEHHRQALENWGKMFWLFYRKLLSYRQYPDPATAAALRAEFDQLFTDKSGYDQLDECKARTLKKRDQLLMVLSHPEILLHNNPAELGARQRVGPPRRESAGTHPRRHRGLGYLSDSGCHCQETRGQSLPLFPGPPSASSDAASLSDAHSGAGPTLAVRGVLATWALNRFSPLSTQYLSHAWSAHPSPVSFCMGLGQPLPSRASLHYFSEMIRFYQLS